MDINKYIEENASDMTAFERQEVIYYIDNAINNFASSSFTTPQSGNILGQYGSTNSNDIDLFFVLKEEKSEKFTKLIEDVFTHYVSAALGGSPLERPIDINFIVIQYGQVVWTNKGSVEIINNAIFNTYHNHITNYDIADGDYRVCPVTSEITMDIGLNALTTVRKLLTIISRTDHGSMAKKMLLNKEFTARLESIQDVISESGIFSSIEDGLGKNQSDESLLKDVAFTFIQLDAMLHDKMIPYSKNAVFNTDHIELLPFIFEMANFENAYALQMVKLDSLISKTIDTLKDRIIMDEGGVVQFSGDNHSYQIRKEQRA